MWWLREICRPDCHRGWPNLFRKRKGMSKKGMRRDLKTVKGNWDGFHKRMVKEIWERVDGEPQLRLNG